MISNRAFLVAFLFGTGGLVISLATSKIGQQSTVAKPQSAVTTPPPTSDAATRKSPQPVPPSLGTPAPQTDAQNKTNTDTPTEADKAALIKAMKDAVAARHGGVLPKTMSEADTNVAAQAAIKWKAKQAAEKTKRNLEAMKVKPPPSNGYAEIFLAKEAITKMMRDPDSTVFGDRKSATGYYVPVVCGTVNGKNGFGGMTGQKRFVALISDIAQSGVWIEDTTPQNVFAPEWNRFCAGRHD
jgi:hypothetical protein